MKTITQSQLVVLLARIRGAKPLTISALVDARCRKTHNPFKEVKKLSRVNGLTSCDYEASVNRQRDREGTEPAFQAKERQWGERVSGALVENKGKWYLPIHIRATAKPVYLTRKTEGEMLMVTPKEQIEAFLPPPSDEGAAQGVDKAIIYRNYSLGSIARITIDGETYRIRHEPKQVNA